MSVLNCRLPLSRGQLWHLSKRRDRGVRRGPTAAVEGMGNYWLAPQCGNLLRWSANISGENQKNVWNGGMMFLISVLFVYCLPMYICIYMLKGTKEYCSCICCTYAQICVGRRHGSRPTARTQIARSAVAWTDSSDYQHIGNHNRKGIQNKDQFVHNIYIYIQYIYIIK